MSIQGIEIGVDWDRADTSKHHALGTQLPRVGGFVMRYVEAGEALVAGNAVTIDYAEGVDVYEHTDAVAEQVHGVVGKALADGEFGWIYVAGRVTGVNCASSVAVGNKLVSSSTAGRLAAQTIAGSYAQAEVQSVQAAAHGLPCTAATAESGNTCTIALG